METKYHKLSKENLIYQSFIDFGKKTLHSLREIENQFQESKQQIMSMNLMMKNVKSILNAYEIIILQLGQYCEILDLRIFGKAIMKMFIQNMSIIKWMLSCFNMKSLEKEKRGKSNIEPRSARGKGTSFTQGMAKESEYYRMREKNKFMAENLDNQINKIEQGDDQAHKRIQQMQNILLKIEPSQTQELIKEASKTLNKKNQYLNDFIAMRNDNMRRGIQDIKVFQLEEIPPKKIQAGIKKLKTAFHKYALQREKQKQEQMIDQECQANIQIKKQQPKTQTKEIKYKQQIAQLSKELSEQKLKSQSLQNLLKAKNDNYEKQLMGMRMQIQITKKQRDDTREKLTQTILELMKVNKPKQEEVKTQNKSQIPSPKKRNTVIIQPKKFEEKKYISKPKFKRYRPLFQQSEEEGVSRTQNLLKSQKQNEIFLICKVLSERYLPERLSRESLLTFNHHQINISIEPLSSFVDIKMDMKKQQLKKELQYQADNYHVAHSMMRRPSITNKNSQISQFLEMKITAKSSLVHTEETKKQSLFASYEPIENEKEESVISSKEKIKENTFISKYKLKKLEQRISFKQEDLTNLFINDEKALAYEFANYNLVSYRKTHHPNDIHRLSRYTRSIGKNKGGNKEDEKLIYLLTKQLISLKRFHSSNYDSIRNFLRFPYSSINKKATEEWQKLSQQEEDLSIQQIRKMFLRLKKIHQECSRERYLCSHIQGFLQKIKVI